MAIRFSHYNITGAILTSLCLHAAIALYLLNYNPPHAQLKDLPAIELQLTRSTYDAPLSFSSAKSAFAPTLRPLSKPSREAPAFGIATLKPPQPLRVPVVSNQPNKSDSSESASAVPSSLAGNRATLFESVACAHAKFLGLDAAARERCAIRFATREEVAHVLTVTPLNPGTAAALQKTAADNEKWRKYYSSKNMDDYPGLMSFLSH